MKLVTGDLAESLFCKTQFSSLPNPTTPPLTDVPIFEHICNIVTVEDVNDNEQDDGTKDVENAIEIEVL